MSNKVYNTLMVTGVVIVALLLCVGVALFTTVMEYDKVTSSLIAILGGYPIGVGAYLVGNSLWRNKWYGRY